jgi:RHH-type rel operon transcriptional repressor/antitoxin RelB
MNRRVCGGMLSVKLEAGMERRLAELARRTGRTKTYYVREMIGERLAEVERRYLGEARRVKMRPRAKNINSRP